MTFFGMVGDPLVSRSFLKGIFFLDPPGVLWHLCLYFGHSLRLFGTLLGFSGILWFQDLFWLFFRDSPEVLWYLCLYLGQSLRFFEGYFGILWDPLVSRSFLKGIFLDPLGVLTCI